MSAASGAGKPQVFPLFPTPAMHVPGALPIDLVRVVLDRVLAEARDTNSKSDLLSHTKMVRPEEDALFAKIPPLIAAHLGEFGALLFGEKLVWHIKEIWVNVLETGGNQALHNHANSFISGVIYLTEQHPGSGTVFHKALGGSNYSFVNQNARTRLGPYSASRWQIPRVSPGDMILFPSYMLHDVPTNKGARRVTMAFNCLPEQLDSFGYTVRFS